MNTWPVRVSHPSYTRCSQGHAPLPSPMPLPLSLTPTHSISPQGDARPFLPPQRRRCPSVSPRHGGSDGRHPSPRRGLLHLRSQNVPTAAASRPDGRGMPSSSLSSLRSIPHHLSLADPRQRCSGRSLLVATVFGGGGSSCGGARGELSQRRR
jgi:hypothetical protein